MSGDIPCCKRQHAGLVSGTVSVESISKHNSLRVDSIKHMLVILDHFVSVALFSCFIILQKLQVEKVMLCGVPPACVTSGRDDWG